MNLKEKLLFLFIPLILLPLVFVIVIASFLFQKIADPAVAQHYIAIALAFIGIVTFVSLFIVVSVSNSISKPLRALTASAAKIAKGDWEVNTPQDLPTRELDHLASVIEQVKKDLKSQQALLKKEAAHAAIGKIATHVAHDLASPLSSVQTSLDIFKDLPSPDQKTLNAIHLLELGAKRLGAISKELLDQHKGDQSKPSLFHLFDVLEELVKEYELQETYGGVAFARDYSPEPVSIYGDRIKIQRVFGNLIKNAVEAMDKCGELTLTTCVVSGSVVTEIKDTGCGMAEDILQKVLNGGFTTGKENGHGIGLSSVRKILEEHKGNLSAESEIGVGTVFRVELPMKKEATDSAEQTKGYHVLVVDDDKTIRLAWEVIQDRLHIEKLHLFPNLESLLESGLDLTSIDIAFVDKNITNSRHDGSEVVSYLKSRGVAKVVLASGESEKQLREDPAFAQADFIVGEKIPRSFKEFFS